MIGSSNGQVGICGGAVALILLLKLYYGVIMKCFFVTYRAFFVLKFFGGVVVRSMIESFLHNERFLLAWRRQKRHHWRVAGRKRYQ